MGSMTEVLHFPHTMIGGNELHSRSVDVQMTDVSQQQQHQQQQHQQQQHQRQQQLQQQPSAPRQISSSTFHTSAASTSNSQLKSEASIQESPVNANAIPPSVQNLQNTASSTSSLQHSPLPSIDTQSPVPSLPSPPRIKVKSLSHIKSFVIDDQNPLSSSRVSSRVSLTRQGEITPQYEISEMPVAEIIEMVAGLLTKITTTNDRQHEYLHRQMPQDSSQALGQQTSSVLAFHGKNVPTISILSYLSRIHKYCPTTYEVFLSLLVYFDRMTERVNSGPIMSLRQAHQALTSTTPQSDASQERSDSSNNGGTRTSSSITHVPDPDQNPTGNASSPPAPIYPSLEDPTNLSHFFVVDSFNIHRLVIAGVTCASKFFSDVFYTNSRYAKVGGLPLNELNQLELQFLILNDFRLAVPLEEMEAYGTMLVEFYAREVLAQQQSSHSSRLLSMSE